MSLRVCLRSLAAAIICVGVNACVPSQSPSDASVPARATDLKKEILERTRAFSQAVLSASASGWSATQVTALADFYDEETIVFPPRGAPLRGRQSVWSYWTRPGERRIVEHAAVAERVDVTNELATEYGRLRITFQVGSASPSRDSATYVSYWRRGGDGIWRKQLDTWW
jgi:ketosteroid isomerase-like protein